MPLQAGYPKYKPKPEEAPKSDKPQYNNLNITTLDTKEICLTWTDNGYQYRLVIPKEGAIGEPERTPLPPPPAKEELEATPAPAAEAPAESPSPASSSISLAEAPAEGFSQYEDGWQYVWKDKVSFRT